MLFVPKYQAQGVEARDGRTEREESQHRSSGGNARHFRKSPSGQVMARAAKEEGLPRQQLGLKFRRPSVGGGGGGGGGSAESAGCGGRGDRKWNSSGVKEGNYSPMGLTEIS